MRLNKDLLNKNEIIEMLKIIIVTLILIVIVRIFLFEFVVVSGSSMYPTMKDGDRLFLSKISYYIDDIAKNDIVVFNTINNDKYIKRVIGTSGDSLYVENDKLYLNNNLIDEYYLDDVYMKSKVEIDGLINFTGDFNLGDLNFATNGDRKEIPTGYIFVMGDNRPDSNDSRAIGLVKEKDVRGKILFKK